MNMSEKLYLLPSLLICGTFTSKLTDISFELKNIINIYGHKALQLFRSLARNKSSNLVDDASKYSM